MGFKSDHIKHICETLYKIDPSLKNQDIEYIVEGIVKQKLKDPSISIDNDVLHQTQEISLIKLCNWVNDKRPIVSGNATFYCQPEVLESPTSNMLKSLKKGRKTVKNQMFQYKEGSDEYQMLDLDQGNKKVIMNAEYGGSGAPSAAFYNKYSPAATTLMAQSIITTMAAFFESYVGNNQKFYNINECFDWMERVCKKDDKIKNWVMDHSCEEVYYRIARHFMNISDDDLRILKMYISKQRDRKSVV